MSMQAHRGDGGIAPTHLKTVLGGGGWQAPGYDGFTPGKTRYPFYRRLGGPQDWSGHHGKVSPHQDSISGPSSPQQVTILTALPLESCNY
jgi:hypothetical protein